MVPVRRELWLFIGKIPVMLAQIMAAQSRKALMSNPLKDFAPGFGGNISLGQRPALVLIDFVQGYFEPSDPLFADPAAVLDRALAVRTAARNAGLPVFYTNVIYHRGGGDGGTFYAKLDALSAFTKDNPMGAWPDGLIPREDEFVISKQYPSAFFGTSFMSTLTFLKVDTLIITGLTTSGCVRATAVDAVSSGLIPIVVEDACGDRDKAPHDANLFDIKAKYGEVMGSADVISYLGSLEPTP